jgi:hypothetical protein
LEARSFETAVVAFLKLPHFPRTVAPPGMSRRHAASENVVGHSAQFGEELLEVDPKNFWMPRGYVAPN